MKEWADFQHYSPDEILMVYEPDQPRHFKPRGIYLSRGNDWWNWTMEAGFSPNIYTHKYAIDLAKTPKLNILNITLDNQDQFIRQYGVDDPTCLIGSLDWSKIAKAYDGIHVNESLIHSHDLNLIRWSSYDVETLVIWTDKLILRFVGEVFYPDYQMEEDQQQQRQQQ
jgi:hypothetical protein